MARFTGGRPPSPITVVRHDADGRAHGRARFDAAAEDLPLPVVVVDQSLLDARDEVLKPAEPRARFSAEQREDALAILDHLGIEPDDDTDYEIARSLLHAHRSITSRNPPKWTP